MAGRVAVAVVAEGACPGRRPVGAFAVPVAVVAEGAGPGRRPVGAVAVPVGVGVDNADTVARSGVVADTVARSGVVASGDGVAPDTAAGTRHASPSARADAGTGNAAAGGVATEWRGGGSRGR